MLLQIIKHLFTAGLPFLLASCMSMSTLQFDVLRPGEVTIEPEIVSVIVMDNTQPFRDDSVHLVTTIERKNNAADMASLPQKQQYIDTIWVDNFGVIAVQSMANALRNKAFFDSVYYHNASYQWTEMTDANKFSTIQQLCRQYNADAVISLEGYAYKTMMETNSWDYSTYGTMDVAGGTVWTIYRKDGVLLDTFFKTDNIFWDENADNFGRLHNLPSQREAVEVMADYLGEAYLQHITPYWETVSRQYFSSGNYLFSRANDLHRANNWDDAAKIWYHVYETGKKAEKAQAAFNIALSYEVRGDFEEAVAWGNISQQLFENLSTIKASESVKSNVNLYSIQLSERYQEKTKLDAQIGPQN
ncbi:MAG: tetratricopeptide repeat protein [Cytophagaceae bacterium]|nr:tetratricopeptide repeat protein [Cytophagaceae bacterium]